MVPIVVIVLFFLGVLGVGGFLLHRRSRISALRQDLEQLAARSDAITAPHLLSRSHQLSKSVQRTLARQADGQLGLSGLSESLPRFTSQAEKLEREARIFEEVADCQKQLEDWRSRLSGHPEGSDYGELYALARDKLSSVCALIDDGLFAEARAEAKTVCEEITVKNQALEKYSRHIEELKRQVNPKLEEAAVCKARIILRTQWERTISREHDAEALLEAGKLAEAHSKLTRLITDMEQLLRELATLFRKQLRDRRAALTTGLEKIATWPPSEREKADKVLSFRKTIEAAPTEKTASPLELNDRLEALSAIEDEVAELTTAHREVWGGYTGVMRRDFQASPLTKVPSASHLPPGLAEEALMLREWRGKLEPTVEHTPGWLVADEVAELLEQELSLASRVSELSASLHARLEALSSSIASLDADLSELQANIGQSAAFETARAELEKQLEAQDFAAMAPGLEQLELDLVRTREEALSRGLHQARQDLERLNLAIGELKGGLSSFADDEGLELESHIQALTRAIEIEDIPAAIRAAGDWPEKAETLVARANARRDSLRKSERESLESEIRAAMEKRERPSVRVELRDLLERIRELEGEGLDDASFSSTMDTLRKQLTRISSEADARRARVGARFESLSRRLAEVELPPGLSDEEKRGFRRTLHEIRIELDSLAPEQARSDTVENDLGRIHRKLGETIEAIQGCVVSVVVNTYRDFEEKLATISRSELRSYIDSKSSECLHEMRETLTECSSCLLQVEMGSDSASSIRPPQLDRLEPMWRSLEEGLRQAFRDWMQALETEIDDVAGSVDGPLSEELAREVEGCREALADIRSSLGAAVTNSDIRAADRLAERARELTELTYRQQKIRRWLDVKRQAVTLLGLSLEELGCHSQRVELESALAELDEALASHADVQALEGLEQRLRSALELGEAAAERARTDVERCQAEQARLEEWNVILSRNKQELEWIRSSLDEIMPPEPSGLDLRRGLAALQKLQHALTPGAIERESAERHHRAFSAWKRGVFERAETQFRSEFEEIIELLHEVPDSARALCAEVLVQIDSVLYSGLASPEEEERYAHLQQRGDAYHRLFGRRPLQ